MTGDTQPDRLRSIAQDGHALLFKPVRPNALKEAVDRLLTKREAGG